MTDEERQLMERYGITVEEKCIYSYAGHKYDRLGDALKYAGIEESRRASASEAQK